MFDNVENQNSRTRTFEIFLLVVIIAVFFSIIIAYVNPVSVLSSARDSQRQYDVIQLSNAVYKYLADSKTVSSLENEAGMIEICEIGTSDIGTTYGKVDLLKVLVDDYIKAMPVDPIDGCNLNDTCYDICKSADGNRLIIVAPNAESYSIEAIR
jgi:hypothetical protein